LGTSGGSFVLKLELILIFEQPTLSATPELRKFCFKIGINPDF
jgi:hypothetical protein